MRYLAMTTTTPQTWVEQLEQSKYLNYPIDTYNEGELVELLEHRIAKILNKPAALFFHKGMTAQFCALKAASEQKQNDGLMLHPLSHLAYDEADSYSELLLLKGIPVGCYNRSITASDLSKQQEQAAILSIELPLRRAGFKLPNWDDLVNQSLWADKQNIHRHLDGARLWESASYYQRSEAEISQLFDTVYVSLYKGLGGMGGAVLAGEPDFIQNCKTWRTRLAGDNFTSFPYLITALDGLDENLAKIPAMCNRAREIAELLQQFPQLTVDAPQTNGFLIFFEGSKAHLNQRADQISESMQIKLFKSITEFPYSNRLMAEIQVGSQFQQISDQEIFDFFTQLFDESVEPENPA